MGKKILFVNPPVLAVVEPWFDEPKFVRTALAHLAGYLRAHCDWEIKCIDAKFNRWDFNKTLNEVLAWQPDLVALTAFTNEVKPAAYLAGLVKAASPDTLTLIGGAHFTACQKSPLRSSRPSTWEWWVRGRRHCLPCAVHWPLVVISLPSWD